LILSNLFAENTWNPYSASRNGDIGHLIGIPLESRHDIILLRLIVSSNRKMRYSKDEGEK